MRQITAVVDFGTSHTVVVVSGPELPATLVSRDGRPWFPSAVFWARDGHAVVGAPAVRLARAEPARIERHPKARIGEQEVLLGDSVVPTTALVRAVLADVVAQASLLARAPVQHLVLTHPADWGSTRLGALMTAAQGLAPRLSAVPEPVGAAAWFTTRHELPIGSVLAVLDFGGGTCDAAVVRREASGLSVVECAGLPDLGGEDLDQRIVEHLGRARPELAALLDAAEQTRPTVAAELADLARLRDNVRRAKETLSQHQQAEVALPGGLPEVLLTRPELEAGIRPDLARAVELLAGAVRSCGLSGNELAAVHLVGGSSRVPLLAQLLRARLPVPVLLDDQPEVVVALGAHAVVEPRATGRATTDRDGADGPPGEPGAVLTKPVDPPERTGPRRWAAAVAVATVVALVAALAALLATGAFDRPAVVGAAGKVPGATALLTARTPAPGTGIAIPGSPTGRLPAVKQGEFVGIRNPSGSATQWRLDSYTDSDDGHRELVRLGNVETPGYRWILVRATEKLVEAAKSYQPARTYLVDDRGLMLSARSDLPKVPTDCPKETPGGNVAAGIEVPQCLVYLVPDATPIVEVAVASLSHEHPTNLRVKESIGNGGRVSVTGRATGEALPLPADAPTLGVPVPMRATTFAADVAVVDTVEDISGYFEVEYSNDQVLGLPGSTALLVRIAARLTEPVDGNKLPSPTVSVEDDRGAVITSPFRSQKNECTPLAPPGRLTDTVVFCALVTVPTGIPVRAVRVKLAPGTETQIWRLTP